MGDNRGDGDVRGLPGAAGTVTVTVTYTVTAANGVGRASPRIIIRVVAPRRGPDDWDLTSHLVER